MTEEKKDNPYVSTETCATCRAAIDQRFEDTGRLVEEKFRGLKNNLAVAFTVTTFIITLVQFYLHIVG